jgi:hypothetical protein
MSAALSTRKLTLVALLVAASASAPARAIPSFARKYGTSCLTCHTVYPKLTPFGEAFRRNSFRFPGTDSDYVKQETIPLTPKTAGSDDQYGIVAIPPLSLGFNGQAVVHPDKNSSGGRADQGAVFLTKDLIAEGHLWAGGSYSDLLSYFAEVTFSSDGSIDLEHAQIYASDLVGPKHAVNVRAGRGFSTLTSFGPHSSYLSDQIMPSSGVTALNGSLGTTWNVFDHFNGFEVNGVLAGRFDYSIGLNAGSNADTRPSENFYGHIGYKIGGLRLDGEGAGKISDAMRPWEEKAVTVDVWVYRSVNSASFANPDATNPTPVFWLDSATVVGGNLRGQLDSLELNCGAYWETHNHAAVDGTGAKLLALYGELSYLVEPSFVPVVRVEYNSLAPDGLASVNNVRILAGIASAVRPNIKVSLTAILESASGQPPGGWGAVGGSAAPAPPADPTVPGPTSVGLEFEALVLGLAFAF